MAAIFGAVFFIFQACARGASDRELFDVARFGAAAGLLVGFVALAMHGIRALMRGEFDEGDFWFIGGCTLAVLLLMAADFFFAADIKALIPERQA